MKVNNVPFDELTNQKLREWLTINSNYSHISKFVSKLDETCHGKDFTINNSIEYDNFIERRRLLFVDTHSWLETMACEKRSYFNAVKNQHLNVCQSISLSHHQQRQLNQFYGMCKNPNEHIIRLCECDIDTIISKFSKMKYKLDGERNLRCHLFGGRASIKHISLVEYEKIIDEIKQCLGAFNWFVNVSNIHWNIDYPIMNAAQNDDRIIEDTVDHILWGSIEQIPFLDMTGKSRWHPNYSSTLPPTVHIKQYRKDFYDKLHHLHDQNTNGSSLTFNDTYRHTKSAYYLHSSITDWLK